METQTKRAGFTLIELLVQISIIAILAGFLAPAMQTARRTAISLTTSNNLRSICRVLEELAKENGKDQVEFLKALDINALLLSDEYHQTRQKFLRDEFVRLEDGGIGYYTANDPGYYVYGVIYLTKEEDIVRELTQLASYEETDIGSYAAERLRFNDPRPLLIFQSRNSTFVSNYGYRNYCDLIDCSTFRLLEEPRDSSPSTFGEIEKPLDRIALATVLATVELLNADEDPQGTARQLKEFVGNPDVIGFMASGFDLNDDNRISVAEFSSVCRDNASRELGPDPTVIETVKQQVFQLLVHELQLNAADDEIEEGVSIDDLTGDPAELFTFKNACTLTDYLAAKSKVSSALCNRLGRAAKAEREGSFEKRDSIVSKAQKQVESLSGISFSVEDADRLDLIYEIQKSERR